MTSRWRHTLEFPATPPTRPWWGCTNNHVHRTATSIGRRVHFRSVTWAALIAAICSSWNSATVIVTCENLPRTIQQPLLMVCKCVRSAERSFFSYANCIYLNMIFFFIKEHSAESINLKTIHGDYHQPLHFYLFVVSFSLCHNVVKSKCSSWIACLQFLETLHCI